MCLGVGVLSAVPPCTLRKKNIHVDVMNYFHQAHLKYLQDDFPDFPVHKSDIPHILSPSGEKARKPSE